MNASSSGDIVDAVQLKELHLSENSRLFPYLQVLAHIYGRALTLL
jgi:hypothetical protein